ncbi:ABC transporter substrate-binding protein [Chlorogloeopsis sp. ULAP02]|uniref:ABC transporter substrate-binding protein n=1 Tax=Chlorogloeopsis sp. ULAP02 TaxID=3107926 RepID=UPI00313601B3
MVKRRRFLKNFSLGTVTALTLIACQDSNSTGKLENQDSNASTTTSSKNPAVKSQTTVKLGAVTGINSIDVWIPYDLGYFKAAGLEAEIIQFKSATKMRDALVAGEIDFSAQAPLHVYLSRLKGIPLKVVANRRNIVDAALIVRKDLEASTRQVLDLKGKSISVGAIGSWSWALTQKYLQHHGLDPSKDVKYVASESSTNYALVKSGQVDAAVTPPPDLTRLIQEQAGFTLVDPTEPSVHQEYFGASEAMTRAWLAHERILKEKPDAIAKLVEAVNQTMQYLHTKSPEEVAETVAKRYEGTPLPVLTESIKRDIKRAIPDNASISKNAYLADQKVFIDTKIVTKLVPYEEGVYDAAAGNRA